MYRQADFVGFDGFVFGVCAVSRRNLIRAKVFRKRGELRTLSARPEVI